MADEPVILVVGSVNMDMVVRVAQMPLPGQTVLGSNFVISPGGKGANQAVAAARLGASCRFLGRVGEDAFGQALRENLVNEGVDCTHLMSTADVPTGAAMIFVDERGENSIVVASGANHSVTPDDVFAHWQAFQGAQAVLLQLELPIQTVRAAIDLARRHGCQIILDPAPIMHALPPELLRVDVVSPNALEAEAMTGVRAAEDRGDKHVASDLIARGAAAAVLKLGPRGCLVVKADGHFYRVSAYDVPVVDTTAAGDAFTAAFATAIARGEHYHQAAKFANAAGALACTRLGAQSAMPTADEVRMLMQDQPK